MKGIGVWRKKQDKDGPDRGPKRLNRLLPASARYQWRFYRVHGRFCNFRKPQTFSEKIFHRMRYPQPVFTQLADKLLVREYIREQVGDAHNVPLYLATDRVTLDTFKDLPAAFVMKSNNGCGHVRIVRDKHQANLTELTNLANRWLREDFARMNGERHYAGIRPSALFEKALLVGEAPVADYKVHVFNGADGGSYEFLQIINDRFGRPTQNLYDKDWLEVAFKIGGRLPASTDAEIVRPPTCLPELLRLARVLARPFGYCRVDFYVYEGQIYVGELTFTPGAGELRFIPEEWDRKLGALIRWPEMPSAVSLPIIPAAAVLPGVVRVG